MSKTNEEVVKEFTITRPKEGYVGMITLANGEKYQYTSTFPSFTTAITFLRKYKGVDIWAVQLDSANGFQKKAA